MIVRIEPNAKEQIIKSQDIINSIAVKHLVICFGSSFMIEIYYLQCQGSCKITLNSGKDVHHCHTVATSANRKENSSFVQFNSTLAQVVENIFLQARTIITRNFAHSKNLEIAKAFECPCRMCEERIEHK